mmetsp:Transcript_17636/g.31087  ORF Transcript_17636/g.31087 Transcript_17636/m.31087 type:complete len:95 (+) Transcript_17636:414-698(+)
MIQQMSVVVGLQKGGMSYMVQAVTVVRRDFGILKGIYALLDSKLFQRISWATLLLILNEETSNLYCTELTPAHRLYMIQSLASRRHTEIYHWLA